MCPPSEGGRGSVLERSGRVRGGFPWRSRRRRESPRPRGRPRRSRVGHRTRRVRSTRRTVPTAESPTRALPAAWTLVPAGPVPCPVTGRGSSVLPGPGSVTRRAPCPSVANSDLVKSSQTCRQKRRLGAGRIGESGGGAVCSVGVYEQNRTVGELQDLLDSWSQVKTGRPGTETATHHEQVDILP